MLGSAAAQAAQPLRLAMDQKPATLNPRMALDAAGQRLGSLLFRSLTRISKDLDPVPDLASGWESLDGERVWRFRIRKGIADHAGQPIDAARMLGCLEEYRTGGATSLVAKTFPGWNATRLEGKGPDAKIRIELSESDPYLPRNISLLRFFVPAPGAAPCSPPQDTASVIGSGAYRIAGPAPGLSLPGNVLMLEPVSREAGPIRVEFVRDENTRMLKVMRGEADAILNALPLTKTRWVQQHLQERFVVLERPGVTVSYLAFNLKDPMLARPEVRRAIALATDRDSIVRYKMFGFGSLAGSLLSPLLPDSAPVDFPYDPAQAEKILDQAGLVRGKDGVRIRLTYRTTPVREGNETARLFQAMLRKVGIELRIEVVEPAVFAQAVRKGGYQLHSSRWSGVSDASILFNTLRSDALHNRWGYRQPSMDLLLDQARKEQRPARRRELLARVQKQVMEDLPYFPLWYWSNALILDRRWQQSSGFRPEDLSLSGGLDPMIGLSAHPPGEK